MITKTQTFALRQKVRKLSGILPSHHPPSIHNVALLQPSQGGTVHIIEYCFQTAGRDTVQASSTTLLDQDMYENQTYHQVEDSHFACLREVQTSLKSYNQLLCLQTKPNLSWKCRTQRLCISIGRRNVQKSVSHTRVPSPVLSTPQERRPTGMSWRPFSSTSTSLTHRLQKACIC